MRINRLVINDFRGFPGPADYEFRLDGKNLLLYGENGSGKSSVFHALSEYFNRNLHAPTFNFQKNVFTKDPTTNNPLQTGKVAVEFDDNSGLHAWDIVTNRKPSSISYTDAAQRFVKIDYRAMLQTNFVHKIGTPNLYTLLVDGILKQLPVTISGGRMSTLGHLVEIMRAAVPVRHTPRKLSAITTAITDVNTALIGHLPAVVTEANGILAAFGSLGIGFDLIPREIKYKRENKKGERLTGEQIDLIVNFHTHKPTSPQHFLNEARLSALALSIFFGSIKASIPTAVTPGQPVPAKIIILDDVIIGLDMSNRLPLLKILQDHFSDWQVILMTHDRAWYEMAQIATEAYGTWTCYEMHAKTMDTGTAVFDSPIIVPKTKDLAKHYLDEAITCCGTNDRVAAFYTRAAFEVKLKSYCHKQRVQVAYDLDGRQLNTDHFLDAIERRHQWSGELPQCLFVIQRIKMFRRGVLNPYAHFHPVTIHTNEVRMAIEAVKKLSFSDGKTDFPSETAKSLTPVILTPEQAIEVACWLRTAFEVDLRALLVQHSGVIKFRHNWTELSLGDLWDSAKDAMKRVNSGLALPLIADIEMHCKVFLDDWMYPTVSTLTKANLDAAWAALRDPTVTPPFIKTRLATFQ
jgi:ABC-type dipeptide/oligopeptide/nickel transport system ATPase component